MREKQQQLEASSIQDVKSKMIRNIEKLMNSTGEYDILRSEEVHQIEVKHFTYESEKRQGADKRTKNKKPTES